MTTVEQIADAILYEGYILYPYRASALKNGQRWNFGVLYPPAYAAAQQAASDAVHHAVPMPGAIRAGKDGSLQRYRSILAACHARQLAGSRGARDRNRMRPALIPSFSPPARIAMTTESSEDRNRLKVWCR